MFVARLNSQAVIGGDTIDQSAVLDIQDTARGVLLPRLTSTQRDAIIKPAKGLMIFNTILNCIQINRGSADEPVWNCLTILPDHNNQFGDMLFWDGNAWVKFQKGQPGQILSISGDGTPIWTGPSITGIDCKNLEQTGELIAGKETFGVILRLPYQGGNASFYLGQTTQSVEIPGLIATILPEQLNTGEGKLSLAISGIPVTPGQAKFNFWVAGKACAVEVQVKRGSLEMLKCEDATFSRKVIYGINSTNTVFSIPYSGGNGGSYLGLKVQSEGISGLLAELQPGNIAQGEGILNFKVTGTPESTGIAEFPINIEGKSCKVSVKVNEGSVSALECENAFNHGIFTVGIQASEIRLAIPYKGGDGGSFLDRTISSTNVVGLSAKIKSGNFQNSNDSLILSISGKPESSGLANFLIEIGDKSCTLSVNVNAVGAISDLKCSEAIHKGLLEPGIEAKEVSSEISYTGGNSGTYFGTKVNSTGVTGLIAVLDTGILASGNGKLVIKIFGIPSAYGKAVFEIRLNDRICILERIIYPCGANMGNGTWKEWMCHNLGAANTEADPFKPSWELNGGYWQWGKKTIAAQGPSGPLTANANTGAISGWITNFEVSQKWEDGAKTNNDPCPEGFKVPSKTDWSLVLENNPLESIGSWTQSENNYSSGIRIGKYLYLPASGFRSDTDGAQMGRGSNGYYWSSTSDNQYLGWNIMLRDCGASIEDNLRVAAFSVRCIKQ